MEDAQAPFDQHAQLLRMLEMTARQRTERQAEVDRLQRAADDYEELRSTLHELRMVSSGGGKRLHLPSQRRTSVVVSRRTLLAP